MLSRTAVQRAHSGGFERSVQCAHPNPATMKVTPMQEITKGSGRVRSADAGALQSIYYSEIWALVTLWSVDNEPPDSLRYHIENRMIGVHLRNHLL